MPRYLFFYPIIVEVEMFKCDMQNSNTILALKLNDKRSTMMHITKNHNCDVPSRIKVPRGRIGVIQGIEKI